MSGYARGGARAEEVRDTAMQRKNGSVIPGTIDAGQGQSGAWSGGGKGERRTSTTIIYDRSRRHSSRKDI